MKTIFTIFSILILVFVFSDSARACSCAGSSAVDIEFETTPNVVILKVQSVEKYQEGETGYGVDGIKQSRLTVEKNFKGNLKIGQELMFAQGGGADCVWTFDAEDIGREYLFYLDSKPAKGKLWEGITCSRSNTVSGASADLLYLENLSKVRNKTRLSGVVSQRLGSAVENQPYIFNRLGNRTIRVVGNKKDLKLKTDKNGVYEIYDLPAGKYKVTPEKVDGFKFDDEGLQTVEVEIEAKSHTEQDFDFEIDNSISGKLYDTNGRLLKDVCMDLLPARGVKRQYFREFDCTNEDGFFEFKRLPIGTYIILVNEDNKVTADSPFGAFYYPNKINREEASEITIGAGDHFKNLIINAPTTAETITISGQINFEKNKIQRKDNFEYAAVEFRLENSDEDKSAESREKVDENGKFTIRILKGQKGKLVGTMSAYEGKFENCPKIDKLIKEKGETFVDLKTEPKIIEAENDLFDVVLTFPFPSCKKAKID
jgi:hypothetical protein